MKKRKGAVRSTRNPKTLSGFVRSIRKEVRRLGIRDVELAVELIGGLFKPDGRVRVEVALDRDQFLLFLQAAGKQKCSLEKAVQLFMDGVKGSQALCEWVGSEMGKDAR